MSIVMEREVTIATDGRIELTAPEALAGVKAHVVIMLDDPKPDRPQMAELLDDYAVSPVGEPWGLGSPQ
jgi:hypothetical protein